MIAVIQQAAGIVIERFGEIRQGIRLRGNSWRRSSWIRFSIKQFAPPWEGRVRVLDGIGWTVGSGKALQNATDMADHIVAQMTTNVRKKSGLFGMPF